MSLSSEQLETLAILLETRPELITAYPLSGLSNQSYRLSIPNHKNYVFRCLSAEANRQYDYRNEVANVKSLQPYKLSQEFIAADFENNFTLREYYSGQSLKNEPKQLDNSVLINIANLFYQLHHLPLKFINDREPTAFVKSYLNEHADYLTNLDVMLVNQVNENCLHLHSQFVDLVPCHYDPILKNFISNDNDLTLIDWEYSANGDPAWDLAYFIIHNKLDLEQENQFLNAYYKQILDFQYKTRVDLYKPIVKLIWKLWERLL